MELIFFSIKKGIPKNSFPYQIIDTHLDNLLSIIVSFSGYINFYLKNNT